MTANALYGVVARDPVRRRYFSVSGQDLPMARFLKLVKLQFHQGWSFGQSRWTVCASGQAGREGLRSGASGGLPVAAFYYVRPSYFLITEVQFKIAVIGSATLARVSVGMMNF